MFHKDSVADPVFKKVKKLFDQKLLYFTSQTSVTGLQAPGEASSPLKRSFSTSKQKFFSLFPFCRSYLPFNIQNHRLS
jgi:hypothetical protein